MRSQSAAAPGSACAPAVVRTNSTPRDLCSRVLIEPAGKREERGSPQADKNPETLAMSTVRLFGQKPDRDGREYRDKACNKADVAEDTPC